MVIMTKHPTPRITGEKFQTKGAVHEHVRHMLLIERLCARFHRVARQLQSRHDHRATLRVWPTSRPIYRAVCPQQL